MTFVSLPEWALWVAMDRDGSWWCYEAEPHQHNSGWYENEIGRSKKLTLIQPLQQSVDWRDSLVNRQQFYLKTGA